MTLWLGLILMESISGDLIEGKNHGETKKKTKNPEIQHNYNPSNMLLPRSKKKDLRAKSFDSW